SPLFILLTSFLLYSILFCRRFLNPTHTTPISTLSLHDALPIFISGITKFTIYTTYCKLSCKPSLAVIHRLLYKGMQDLRICRWRDRKSTRLNSSHVSISYAVFCLKKKKNSIRTSVLHPTKPLTR